MTDFDSRARSAARAVHDLVASDDAPAVDTVAVSPRKRGTARALFVAAAVVLVVTGSSRPRPRPIRSPGQGRSASRSGSTRPIHGG